MRESKSQPRKAGTTAFALFGPEKATRLSKSKSQNDLRRAIPCKTANRQQKASQVHNSLLRPKRIKKHSNGNSGAEYTAKDIKTVEELLTRETKVRTTMDVDKSRFVKQPTSNITAFLCVSRLKTNILKLHADLRFDSNRKATEMRLYNDESDILTNAEIFEDALRHPKADDDLDTDDELLKLATTKVAKQLEAAINKYKCLPGRHVSSYQSQDDRNEAERNHDGKTQEQLPK